jgi:peroxiredoxin
MNRIKSIFISSAILYWDVVGVWAIYEGINNNHWYIGLLMASLIPVLFILRLFVFKTARTTTKLKPITFLVVIGLGLEFQQYLNDNTALLALELSLLSLIIWMVYVNWYSVFPNREMANLKVGMTMPKLSFTGIDGGLVKNTDFKGKNLLYLFYRGNWCPLCMAQVKEISEKYQEINELDTEVLLISPQPHKFTVSLAKKRNVSFVFLEDKNNEVAKKLGIFAKGGTPLGMEVLGFDSDTVLPTVIITDKKEKIIFIDQTDNYRVRPEPDTFLKILKQQPI